jgi:hypothetical protein
MVWFNVPEPMIIRAPQASSGKCGKHRGSFTATRWLAKNSEVGGAVELDLYKKGDYRRPVLVFFSRLGQIILMFYLIRLESPENNALGALDAIAGYEASDPKSFVRGCKLP